MSVGVIALTSPGGAGPVTGSGVVRLDPGVAAGEPLLFVDAGTRGEPGHLLEYAAAKPDLIQIEA